MRTFNFTFLAAVLSYVAAIGATPLGARDVYVVYQQHVPVKRSDQTEKKKSSSSPNCVQDPYNSACVACEQDPFTPTDCPSICSKDSTNVAFCSKLCDKNPKYPFCPSSP
jgi:hypothetical protein